MLDLVLTCVIAISTPNGPICVKPDGNVDIPANVEITEASKEFWWEISKIYQVIQNDKCIGTGGKALSQGTSNSPLN